MTTTILDATPTQMPGPSPKLRMAGALLATCFRWVPQRLRYALATRVARLLRPLIRRTATGRWRVAQGYDGVAEITLELLLKALTRHGVWFDPQVTLTGAECLPPPGRGVLVLGAHSMLNELLLRPLDAAGYRPVGIAADPTLRMPGSDRPFTVLQVPSQHLFLRVRRCLKEGHAVLSQIDRLEGERGAREIELGQDRFHASDALLRLAARLAVPVVFMYSQLEHGRAVVHLAKADVVADGDAMLQQFATFCARYRRARPTEAGQEHA